MARLAEAFGELAEEVSEGDLAKDQAHQQVVDDVAGFRGDPVVGFADQSLTQLRRFLADLGVDLRRPGV